jgi:hypothetical protein
MTSTHRLDAELRVLNDGRRVTLRHAVPSDAPRLASGRVALDDHGTIVGHVGLASGPVVLAGWMGSGLAPLLAGLSDAK